MHSGVLKYLSVEESAQLPVYSLHYFSVIGRGIAQWKRIETKALAFKCNGIKVET
jgi:hypothetical protein